MIRNYEAWSPCGRYGLRISGPILIKMLNFCKMSTNTETGGILVGYYNKRHDCAIVTDCSGPPSDSILKRGIFQRGIRGLQQWINKLWALKKRRYYLGEWHYHTLSEPNPSRLVDVQQIMRTSKEVTYRCPEPIMVILGGDANREWCCKSFVYLIQEGLIELVKGWEPKIPEIVINSKGI